MPVEVVPYSIKEFATQLRAKSEATEELVAAKLRARYFEDYFSTVGVKTTLSKIPTSIMTTSMTLRRTTCGVFTPTRNTALGCTSSQSRSTRRASGML